MQKAKQVDAGALVAEMFGQPAHFLAGRWNVEHRESSATTFLDVLR